MKLSLSTSVFRSERLRNTGVTLVSSFGIQLLGIGTGVMTARVLGPEERGQLALVMLLPLILGFVGDLGTDRAGTFLAAKPNIKLSDLYMTLAAIGVFLGLGSGLLVLCLGVPIMSAQSENIGLVAAFASLCVPLSIFSRYGQSLLQGQLRMGQLAIARLAEPTVYLTLLAALASTSTLSIMGAVVARVLAQLGVIGFSWIPLIRAHGLGRYDPRMRAQLFSYGLRGLPVKLSPSDTLQLDQWLIGLFLGTTELAYYVVALAALGPARIIPVGLGMIIVPIASKVDHIKEVKSTIILGIAGSGLVALVMFAAMPVALPLLFGEQYRPAVVPAQFMALAALPAGARELFVSLLYGRGYPGKSSVVELLSFAALVVGLLILLNPLGLLGAAVALLLSYVVGAIVALKLAHSVGPLTRGFTGNA